MSRRIVLAWGVHAFTTMGCVAGFFAIPAVARDDYRTAFLCLIAAVVIDSIDGTLARAVHVKVMLPDFDGKMLDYVFDFLNFVITPAFVLYHARLTGDRFAVASVVAILLVSSYHYANVRAMTPDLYFKGFPAFWNVVVFYLFVLELGPSWNLAIVALFCVLHFVPIKWIAVSRTRHHQLISVLATAGAAATAVAVVLLLPEPPRWMVWTSTGCVAWLVVASLHHTLTDDEVSA